MSTKATWSGRHFELNMSFATLRDSQWTRLINVLWEDNRLEGPFVSRFIPGEPRPEKTDIQYPAPTATYTQHGILVLGEKQIGVDILVTRSLFECISMIVPSGMLGHSIEDLTLIAVHEAYKALALQLYQTVAFEIASIGWNRDCQLLGELLSDKAARDKFFKMGNFLVQDGVLKALGVSANTYMEAMPGIRWAPPLIYQD